MIEYEKFGLNREIVRHYLDRIAFRRKAKLEQRANFDEKFPEDPITAFLALGNRYFDSSILIARKRELAGFEPYHSTNEGESIIFHQRIPGRRYIIGADCATGRTVSSTETDYCAAVALDLETGEEMGALHARITPEDFALDLADFGRYFNNAIIAVERTGDGGTCIMALKGDCKYSGIYMHKMWFRRERKTIVEVEGFPTDVKHRPIALNKLNRYILDYPERIWDEKFIDEALVFVRDEKGKPAATPGAHDDRVSARWIAHYCRLVMLGYLDPLNTKSEGYVSADRLVDEAA